MIELDMGQVFTGAAIAALVLVWIGMWVEGVR